MPTQCVTLQPLLQGLTQQHIKQEQAANVLTQLPNVGSSLHSAHTSMSEGL